MDETTRDLARRVAMLERDLAALHTEPPSLPAGPVADVPRNATFEQSVDLFLDANPWVGDEHVLYVTALFKLARQLDHQNNPSAAAIMEFRQNATALRQCRPEDAGDEDSFEKALADLRKGL